MAKKKLTAAMWAVINLMVASIQAGKPDEQILAESKTDKIGDDDCTPELLEALLERAKSQAGKPDEQILESKNMFGNKDEDEKYSFPKTWAKSVVVRESVETQIGPKATDVAEIPSSVQIKPFDASLFDTHVKQGMFNKKRVEIIHDPR